MVYASVVSVIIGYYLNVHLGGAFATELHHMASLALILLRTAVILYTTEQLLCGLRASSSFPERLS